MSECWNRFVGYFLVVLIGLSFKASGQVKWDGEGGDGMWNNPQNWVGNRLPDIADRVVLDNSFISGSYEILIGPGALTVTISSVLIEPGTGSSIALVIPAENTAAPALICTAEGYSLDIGPGGTFRNASGASAGAPLEVKDSIRINNGGSFIHNTPRSHANNVRALSRAPGTEDGEFEFRIPVASSTVSVSGQVFGRLKLTPGLNNTVNYTGTGTNDLTVRSDLEIGDGVNLNFNLLGLLSIGGKLIQHNSTLNLGTTARQLTVLLKGDLVQDAGGVITETGQAFPVLRLAGEEIQTLKCEGFIVNDVELQFDNSSGISLTSNLQLTHTLRLDKGAVRTNGHLVKFGPAATIQTTGEGYIDGKVYKSGLVNGDFLFPVGKNGFVRWVSLREATGNFLVEFVPSDPRLLAANLGNGLSHISGLEHWIIMTETADATAKIELSFHDVHSGGVTSLEHLRVAQLQNNAWVNAGNIGFTGTAGSVGSVLGGPVTDFETGVPQYFTLASSNVLHNPLPLKWQSFTAHSVSDKVILQWEAESTPGAVYIPERSADGLNFKPLGAVPYLAGRKYYSWIDEQPVTGNSFYRIREKITGSADWASGIISVDRTGPLPLKRVITIRGRQVQIAAVRQNTGGPNSGSQNTGTPGAGGPNRNSGNTGSQLIFVTDLAGRLILLKHIRLDDEVINFHIPVTIAAGSILNFTIVGNGVKKETLRAVVQ